MRDFDFKYIWPNLFTTGALYSGFWSILSAFEGQFSRSALLIFIAMVCDGLDGRVARWTRSESAFGVQYDSLADLVSFGVAPSILIFEWALRFSKITPAVPSRLGLIVAFLYLTCTALRLARFNVQVDEVDKSIFVGLPSPSGAGVVAGFVWFGQNLGLNGQAWFGTALIITFGSALAMVSNLPYYSFKTFKLEGNYPPIVRKLLPALIIALIALEPEVVLFVLFSLYALHAPIWWWWRQRKV